ncbi:MAG: hypothetical protein AB7F35_15680 [Acetobacteraceae bacterium]
MGSLSTAGLIAIATVMGGLTYDMGLNALQDWYHTVYMDAFWGSRVTDSPALRDLAKEEAEINRLLADSDFSDKRVVIGAKTAPAKPAAR